VLNPVAEFKLTCIVSFFARFIPVTFVVCTTPLSMLYAMLKPVIVATALFFTVADGIISVEHSAPRG
jgi:hypothetical protein